MLLLSNIYIFAIIFYKANSTPPIMDQMLRVTGIIKALQQPPVIMLSVYTFHFTKWVDGVYFLFTYVNYYLL